MHLPTVDYLPTNIQYSSPRFTPHYLPTYLTPLLRTFSALSPHLAGGCGGRKVVRALCRCEIRRLCISLPPYLSSLSSLPFCPPPPSSPKPNRLSPVLFRIFWNFFLDEPCSGLSFFIFHFSCAFSCSCSCGGLDECAGVR